MSNWSWLEQQLPPYALMLASTGFLGVIAHCAVRIRKSLRGMHYIAASEFSERRNLGKTHLEDLP
jgi:hypothetical protein